jgi:hypothetical protein
MRKFSIVFVVLCVVALVANAAFAGLVIKVTGPDGATTVGPGTFQGEIWATVTGSDADLTNEYLVTVCGGLQLAGAGTFSPFVPATNLQAPFTFGVANPVDTSADGKLIGHGGQTAFSGQLYMKSGTSSNPNPGERGDGPYKLATFTVNNAAAGDVVSFLKAGANLATLSYRWDGTNNVNGGGTSWNAVVTTPLTVVPEPSTMILLGMGALALVFVRRRK